VAFRTTDFETCCFALSAQGRRDLNPQPPVLETGALPIELLPSVGRVLPPSKDSTGQGDNARRSPGQEAPGGVGPMRRRLVRPPLQSTPSPIGTMTHIGQKYPAPDIHQMAVKSSER